MAVSVNELAIQTTKLANQRTYLAYMRTGFVIAAIAGNFKKYWVMSFGLIMIVLSSMQYAFINDALRSKKIFDLGNFDNFPLIYLVLSLGVLYIEFNK